MKQEEKDALRELLGCISEVASHVGMHGVSRRAAAAGAKLDEPAPAPEPEPAPEPFVVVNAFTGRPVE